MSSFKSFLGSGLIRPFQRDGKGDFAHAEASSLIRATIGQVLGTRAASAVAQGELPWRTEAGSLLYTLRHANNSPANREKARIFAQEALARQDTRVRVLDIELIEPERIDEQNQMVLKVVWAFIDQNVPGNQVLLGPDTVEVLV